MHVFRVPVLAGGIILASASVLAASPGAPEPQRAAPGPVIAASDTRADANASPGATTAHSGHRRSTRRGVTHRSAHGAARALSRKLGGVAPP